MQVSVHREVFTFFLGRGQICFEFDSAVVKREKTERTKKKKDCGQRQRKFFYNFSQGFVFGEGSQRLFTPGVKNFSCSRRRCSRLLVRN